MKEQRPLSITLGTRTLIRNSYRQLDGLTYTLFIFYSRSSLGAIYEITLVAYIVGASRRRNSSDATSMHFSLLASPLSP